MRYLLIILFLVLFSLGHAPFANSTQCLPTCSSNDGRFLTVPGAGLSTISGTETLANFISTGENLEFGIFDGDSGLLWDLFTNDPSRLLLRFELFADPLGDGTGVGAPLATWTSDGSSGQNTGQPMPDNDWFDIVLANDPSALNDDGNYVYTLRAFPINPITPGTSNNFKLRTQERMFIPAFNPMSFISPFGSEETPEAQTQVLLTLYPNLTCNNGSPTCADGVCGLPPNTLCDLLDPSCCFFETTYDGTWRFFMEVPEGLTSLEVWDGDFDVGNYDFTTSDTNDPNTPGDPFLPPWAMGTAAIFQAAQGIGVPPDNVFDPSTFIFARNPNIEYTLFDPMSNGYLNINASGNQEWEVFRLSTLTDDPAVAEFMVSNIPAGVWEVRVMGADISNLNSLVLPFDLLGVGEDGLPVDPVPPSSVPALSEWGLIAMAAILGIVGFMVVRRRQVNA